MGKIVLVMGPAYSGKYEILRNLVNDETFNFRKIIRRTTRTPHPDEVSGEYYLFQTQEQFLKEQASNQIVEYQEFSPKENPIYFYTTSSDIDLAQHNYLTEGNINMFDQLIAYYGPEKIISILTQMDRYDRIKVGLDYQMSLANPNYKNLCETYIKESEEYAKENIEPRNITGFIQYNKDKEQMITEAKMILSKHL